MPSNQKNQQTWSPTTPTTEPTVVLNSAVPYKQLNLFNKYLLLVTFETNDNYSIRFKMKKHTIRTALIIAYYLTSVSRSYSGRFNSVQFTKAIYIVQLSRMSHCAPATRKPVRFKFTPEAYVGDVLVT